MLKDFDNAIIPSAFFNELIRVTAWNPEALEEWSDQVPNV